MRLSLGVSGRRIRVLSVSKREAFLCLNIRAFHSKSLPNLRVRRCSHSPLSLSPYQRSSPAAATRSTQQSPLLWPVLFSVFVSAAWLDVGICLTWHSPVACWGGYMGGRKFCIIFGWVIITFPTSTAASRSLSLSPSRFVYLPEDSPH